MKKVIIGLIVFILILAFTLPIYASPVISVNASPNAAFGQARASWIQNHEPGEWGDLASDRAGTNAALNHQWMKNHGVGPYK